MTSLSPVTSSIIEQKNTRHLAMVGSGRKLGILTFLATLITLFALAAIISSVVCIVCFTGINVVQQIILPVVLPACLALVCVVIPLMAYILLAHKKMQKNLKELGEKELNAIKAFYQQQVLRQPDKKEIADFIAREVINIPTNKLYRQEFLQVVKGGLPKKKKRSEDESNLAEGINRAIENIKLSAQQRKRRDEQEAKESKKKTK